MEQRVRVLLIEDDPDYTMLMNMYVNEACGDSLQYLLASAESLQAGLDLLARDDFDIVLTDLMLPDSRGLDTLVKVRATAPGLPIVVLTNNDQGDVGIEAIARGAQDFLTKSKVDAVRLRHAIGYALERNRLFRQMETLVDGSPDGVVIVDRERLVRYANPAALSLFSKSKEDMIGRLFDFETVPGRSVELKIPAPARPDTVAEMRVAEIEWRGGPARLATLRDVTEIKKLEEVRAEVRERARMDQLKDQLLSTVAHELRTPLSVIKAVVGTLRDRLAGPMNAEQESLISSADRNINRLTRLLNNFLDLSRLESRRARVNRQAVEPLGLIREVGEGVRMANRAKPVVFLYDLPESAPEVHVDPDMIAQVLGNLLDNALRYARARILVRAAKTDGALEVSVQDDGPGIPPEKVGALFDKFVQLDRPRGGSGYKGTGLGLAISREIVTLNDGRIWVESGGGRGACFRFTLPLAATAAASGEPAHD
ncbi:MAG: response regulator [Elusimicrobia bacterium]|nr:response regulator [Elusimicrobiota bacterium]